MANKNNQTVGQAAQTPPATAPAQQAATQPSGDAATGSSTPAGEGPAQEDPELVALRDEVQELTEQLAIANGQIGTLQNQLTDERTRSGDLAGELNESEKLIEDLQARLKRADVRQAESGTVIVSDGTDDYKVLAPKFKHKHVEYTADELKANEALVQELVAAGVGFLLKIEAPAQ